MDADTRRRLLLGLGGLLCAALVTVLVQYTLLRATVAQSVAEGYAVIVGIGTATPFLQATTNPVTDAGGRRYRVAVLTSAGGLLAGLAAGTLLVLLNITGSLLVAVGAGGAYAGGALVRSYLLEDDSSER